MIRQVNAPALGDRTCGILLHPTSLPGPYGTGDLGPEAREWAHFLKSAGQRWWQMLPLGPPLGGWSPYQTASSFAGNPLLISPEDLCETGLLSAMELSPPAGLARKRRADFSAAWKFKEPLLRRAFTRFMSAEHQTQRGDFEAFRAQNSWWLADYSLFSALRSAHRGLPWNRWEPGLRGRADAALQDAVSQFAGEILFEEFLQFIFDRQWRRLKTLCGGLGIGLLGDVPIYTALDSADVWSRPHLFDLSESGQPVESAGVPPDYFSKNGQLWGNPVYRWDAHKNEGYAWWISRLGRNLELFDATRLDHFIGFHRYWAVPARAKTARTGCYRPGPGAEFFEKVREGLQGLPFIAEDLGNMTPEVADLREQFSLPGMIVLQFSFSAASPDENFRPEACPSRAVVYTGTHDNDTTLGWYRENASKLPPFGVDESDIPWELIRRAMMSQAQTAIVPLQDVLGLGTQARMNRPGTTRGNWAWRVRPGAFGEVHAAKLRGLAEESGRVSPVEARPTDTT